MIPPPLPSPAALAPKRKTNSRKWQDAFLFAALLLTLACAPSETTAAESFYDFTPAIPDTDADGIPLAGSNTTFADRSSLFRPDVDTARSHRWTWRDFGNGGILHSLGPDNSTLPVNTKELVTKVSGLDPGSEYAVRALFWSSGGTAAWGLRASLVYAWGSRSNPWFDKNSPKVLPANLLPWNAIPSLFSEGGRTLYAISLGITTADPHGNIEVFIHDLPSANSNFRVWYDGVAVSRTSDAARHID